MPSKLKESTTGGWANKYGRSMMNDFNSGAVGWTEWNILSKTIPCRRHGSAVGKR